MIGGLSVDALNNIDLACSRHEYKLIKRSTRLTSRRPVRSHRPICRPNAASVRHREEVCNEQAIVVSLLRRDTDATVPSISCTYQDACEDLRVAFTPHGDSGEVINSQNRSPIILHKSQTLLDGVITILEVYTAVSRVIGCEEIPFTWGKRVRHDEMRRRSTYSRNDCP